MSKLLKYGVQYGLIRSGLWLSGLLPFGMRGKVVGVMGGIVVRYVPFLRKRAEAGLSRVYPNMPKEQRLNLARSIGGNTARTLVELLYNAEFAKYAQDLPVSGPGLAALEQAKASGKGAVIVSGHFGQWEAIRHVLMAKDLETGAIYRRNNNPYYEPLFVSNVEQGGKPLVPKGKAGTKDMVRHLRKGGFMAILADQKHWAGESLDFMGHPALTSLAPAELALKYDIPLVPAYGTRTKTGIEVTFEAPIPPSDTITMMQAVNDSLAAKVHADPSQWHWLHQRWGEAYKK